MLRTYGPCPTCGEFFQSVRAKQYCNLKCWNLSPEFARVLETMHLKRMMPKVLINCLECEKLLPLSPSQAKKRKFCNSECYRLFHAKRFDRWIASPQKIALPQNYDEFLTMNKLPCLVEGCNWNGHNLTMHMNRTHGAAAARFKLDAGFNQTTPVVSGTLLHAMQTRVSENAVAALKAWKEKNMNTPSCDPPRTWTYPMALEGREHHIKGRIVALNSNKNRIIVCGWCEREFEVPPYSTRKYCCDECKRNRVAKKRRDFRILLSTIN